MQTLAGARTCLGGSEPVAADPEHVPAVCLSLCPSVPGAALAGTQAGGTRVSLCGKY